MNILIQSALKSEIGDLINFCKPLIIFQNKRSALYSKNTGKNTVYFGITGIGPKNIRRFFEQAMPEIKDAGLVISTGYAGAVKPHLRVGDIAIASSISGPGNSEIVCPDQSSVLDNLRIDYLKGNCYTSNGILGKKEKYQLRIDNPGIDFVDMESRETAVCCNKYSLLYLIIRAISDMLDFDFPDLEFIQDSWNRIDKAKLVFHLVKKPVDIIRIIKFLMNISIAKKRIFKTLKLIVEKIVIDN